MAGYTSSAFRLLARRAGAGLVFSEVIAVKGLLYGSKKTRALLFFREEERPIGIQLLGSEPEEAAEAVKIVEEIEPDLIDLNLGCPKRKVTRKGAGGALLRNPERAVEFVRAAVEATDRPVTVKTRLPGPFDPERFTELCLQFAAAGIKALTVHPRTVGEAFRGKARWDIFRELTSAVPLPVIASGDVKSAGDAKRLFEAGCAGVMIGRAAVGNPAIFDTIQRDLEGEPPRKPSVAQRIDTCLEHLDLLEEEKGEARAVCELRKQLSRYLKGIPHCHRISQTLIRIPRSEELREELRGLRRIYGD